MFCKQVFRVRDKNLHHDAKLKVVQSVGVNIQLFIEIDQSKRDLIYKYIFALWECIVVSHPSADNEYCDATCSRTCSPTDDAVHLLEDVIQWTNECRELKNSRAYSLHCTNKLLQISIRSGGYQFKGTTIRRGLNDIPLAEMIHLHQRMEVANKAHSARCSLRMYKKQNPKSKDIALT